MPSSSLRNPSAGDLAELAKALAADAAAAEALNRDGELPLHLAAREGHVAMVKELLALCRRATTVSDRYGETPLHNAARNDPHHGAAAAQMPEVVALLIQVGPAALLQQSKRKFGKCTPLQVAQKALKAAEADVAKIGRAKAIQAEEAAQAKVALRARIVDMLEAAMATAGEIAAPMTAPSEPEVRPSSHAGSSISSSSAARAQEQADGDDDEMEVEESDESDDAGDTSCKVVAASPGWVTRTLPLTCGISHREMTEPARGPGCLHLQWYERKWLKEYVGREHKCPSIGCAAQLTNQRAVVVDSELIALLSGFGGVTQQVEMRRHGGQLEARAAPAREPPGDPEGSRTNPIALRSPPGEEPSPGLKAKGAKRPRVKIER